MPYGYVWINGKAVEAPSKILFDTGHPSDVPICDLDCYEEDRWGYFKDDEEGQFWVDQTKQDMPKEFIATLFLLGIN